MKNRNNLIVSILCLLAALFGFIQFTDWLIQVMRETTR